MSILLIELSEAQLMGGYGNHAGSGGQKLSLSCDPAVEGCSRDVLFVGTGVIAFIVLAGVACWLVLSGRWSLMLIRLEQKIRSLLR